MFAFASIVAQVSTVFLFSSTLGELHDGCTKTCTVQVRAISSQFAAFEQGKEAYRLTRKRCARACAQAYGDTAATCGHAQCAHRPECIIACWHVGQQFFRGKNVTNTEKRTVEQIRDLVTKSSICTRSRLSLKNKKKAVKLSTRIFWLPLSSLHSESSVKQETSIASRPIAVFRTRHFVGMQSAVNFVHVRHDSQAGSSSMDLGQDSKNHSLDCFGYLYFVEIPNIYEESMPHETVRYSFHTFDICSPHLDKYSRRERRCFESGQHCQARCPAYRAQCSDKALRLLVSQHVTLAKGQDYIDVYPLVSIANLQAKLEPNCTASDRAASLLGKPREFSLKVHWHRQVGIPTNDNLRDQQPEHTPTCWCQKSCEIVYTVKVIDQKGKTVAQREAVSEKAHLESNIKLSLVCEEERSTLQVIVSGHFKDDSVLGPVRADQTASTVAINIDPCRCSTPAS